MGTIFLGLRKVLLSFITNDKKKKKKNMNTGGISASL